MAQVVDATGAGDLFAWGSSWRWPAGASSRRRSLPGASGGVGGDLATSAPAVPEISGRWPREGHGRNLGGSAASATRATRTPAPRSPPISKGPPALPPVPPSAASAACPTRATCPTVSAGHPGAALCRRRHGCRQRPRPRQRRRFRVRPLPPVPPTPPVPPDPPPFPPAPVLPPAPLMPPLPLPPSVAPTPAPAAALPLEALVPAAVAAAGRPAVVQFGLMQRRLRQHQPRQSMKWAIWLDVDTSGPGAAAIAAVASSTAPTRVAGLPICPQPMPFPPRERPASPRFDTGFNQIISILANYLRRCGDSVRPGAALPRRPRRLPAFSRKIRSARLRVGRMLSRRLGRLMVSQAPSPNASASAAASRRDGEEALEVGEGALPQGPEAHHEPVAKVGLVGVDIDEKWMKSDAKGSACPISAARRAAGC